MSRIILWADAKSLILPDLKDCPWEMAKSRLILAAREFYARTGAWRQELETTSIADVADYPEVSPNDAELVRAKSAFYGTEEITPLVPTDFFKEQTEDPSSATTPEFMTVNAGVLWLHRPPLESGVEIKAEVTLKPLLTATGLPEDLWNEHIEHIVEGAKYRLYKSQAKPYTDLNLAALARDAFTRAMGVSGSRARRGSTRAARRVRAHYF